MAEVFPSYFTFTLQFDACFTHQSGNENIVGCDFAAVGQWNRQKLHSNVIIIF